MKWIHCRLKTDEVAGERFVLNLFSLPLLDKLVDVKHSNDHAQEAWCKHAEVGI